VSDPDRAVIWPDGIDGELPDRLWAPGELTVRSERAEPELTWSLISLAFIRGALRRTAKLWCVTGILGLVIGAGLFVKYPPAYHATATVLVVDNPSQDPSVEVLTDQSLAESEPVAARVVHELGLPQSAASSFQTAYTVTVLTDTVLTFDVGARTSAEAVREASAVAKAFLWYRARYAQTQEQQLLSVLDQQYNAAEKHLHAIDVQLSQIASTQLTGAAKVQYDGLLSQQGQQQQVINYVTGNRATAKTATETMVSSSYVLDPATPVKHSKLKSVGLYAACGLLVGVAVGMAIAIIGASLSGRLRRRSEVAAALGAPVRLSVGSLGASARLSVPPRQGGNRDLDMRRVVAHLRGAVPADSRVPASLAVIAVDDPRTAAQAVASLAESCAREGGRVVVADLVSGAPLARLLGEGNPGVHPVSRNGARLLVAVPGRDDVPPVGPLPGGNAQAIRTQPDEAVVTAVASADLLLTLAMLDPALGGDHLATWATDAVAVVTAGQSSIEKAHSVGEMIRLAGTRLDSVILIGADRNDESLGVLDSADQSALIQPI
jgi:capsular polysaccharide biosynthesis protein